MFAAASALMPVFLVILSGVVLRRTLLTEEAQWIGLERLTYFVLFPVLLIQTLAKAHLTTSVGVSGLVLMATVAINVSLVLALRVPLTRALRLNGPAYTSLFQAVCRWNTFIALSVAGSLYGEVGVTVVAVAIVAMVPVLNVTSVAVLARYASAARPHWREVLRLIAANPFIWSTAAGIAINLTGLPVPAIVMNFGDILGRAALGIGLLLVGAGLQVGAAARPRPATLASVVWKLVLVPCLAGGLALAAGVSGVALIATVICAAVPTASNAYVLARQMGGDAPLVAEMVTVQTAVALVTMPAMIALVEILQR